MHFPDRHYVQLSVFTMLAVGIVFVYSSTAHSSEQGWILTKHFASIGLGISAMLLLMFTDYRNLRKASKPMMVFSLLLLLLVLFVGAKINGARRWFILGPISFQPTEVAKIVFLVYFADYFCRKQEVVKEYMHGLVPAVINAGICLAFIAVEPDLGTALLLGGVVLTMLCVAGFRLFHIVPTAMVAGFVAFSLMLVQYKHFSSRIASFFTGEPGFQVRQALIALGSGGITGHGLGEGMQKLNYVPLATTDFAFAVVGEETGFIGALFVLCCYSFFAYFGLQIARSAKDLFGMLLATGITLLITCQALINLGVVSGVLPNKGIPLPFISAGGSAMVFLLAGVGILLSIGRVSELECQQGLVGGRLRS